MIDFLPEIRYGPGAQSDRTGSKDTTSASCPDKNKIAPNNFVRLNQWQGPHSTLPYFGSMANLKVVLVSKIMFIKTPTYFSTSVDIIIVKDISNKDDLFKFRKIYSILNKPILVWISSDKSDDINFIIKLSDGVVYDFYEDDVILSDSTYVFKKCKEMHKPIILSRPIEVEEYTNNIMKLMPSAHKLDALSLDGIVLEDTKNQKNIAHDVYNVFIALVRIDLIKENEQRIREYMEIRAELKLPVLPPLSVAHAACLAAVNSEATLIIVLSRSGRSAKWVSLARPPCHIVVITTQASTARKLHVYKQIIPLFYNRKLNPLSKSEFSVSFMKHFILGITAEPPASLIIVLSRSGRSAKWISLARPPCHIVVITTQASTARKLHVYKQIIPLFYNRKLNPLLKSGHSRRKERRVVSTKHFYTWNNSGATLIIVLSRSGRSAKWISLARPPCHILVITTQASTARKLHVYKQIIPLFYNRKLNPLSKLDLTVPFMDERE
ncbi:pyruvate kinase, alpha/beta domain-containing protein [Phthorimaea operculella]|nr:pyruvate kinase, alpha/beta domain-containing protein [Phthorimaea operculella]